MMSVSAPLATAYAWTKQVLFRPPSLEKWLTLGFCAFLAHLGQGGGGGWNGLSRLSQAPGHRDPLLDQAHTWVLEHLTLVITVAAIALVAILALTALLMWLGSRGTFMFLDGVVRNRGEVAEPWHRYRRLGNSLFLFRFALGALALGLVLAALGLGVLVAWRDFSARTFGFQAVLGLAFGGCLTLLIVVLFAVLDTLVRDFVVPVMALKDLTAGHAFGLFWTRILPGNGVAFLLYFLLKMALSVAAGLVIVLGGCLTCCLGFLPYVSSVLFLPITVFFQSFALAFLAQAGEEWRMLPEDGREAPTSAPTP